MRATYDPGARAIAIVLDEDARHREVVEVADGSFVGLRDGVPVLVELVGLGGSDAEQRLAAVAAAHRLDGDALKAAFRAALAVPGREVTLAVTAAIAS